LETILSQFHPVSILQPNFIRFILITAIKSRRMKWVGHVARMGTKNAYNILVRKRERKRQLERYRCRLENNIKMDNKDI